MPARRPCAACGHPERQAIDAALVAGTMSLRAIIRAHGGMNLGGLSRHRDRHLEAALRAEKPARARSYLKTAPSNP